MVPHNAPMAVDTFQFASHMHPAHTQPWSMAGALDRPVDMRATGDFVCPDFDKLHPLLSGGNMQFKSNT